jgi:hypothetical protein
VGKLPVFSPPQTNISLPVHTATWRVLADGALPVDVGVHESEAGT